jgi:hypothetical protein
LEAAKLRRPLILRELPELSPWLIDSGGKFPLLYRDIEIPKRLISQNEKTRWEIGWEDQCTQLPAAWRNLAKTTSSNSSGTFSGFSVSGQLELLRNWNSLEPELLEANSWLHEWKSLASANELPPATAPNLHRNWVEDMDRLLGQSPSQGSAMEAVEDLFKTTLPDAGKFPILWQSPQTSGGK